jgi:NAD+ kinase
MNKIGIIINPEKDQALCYLDKIIQILKNNNIEYAVSCGSYPATADFKFCSAEECFNGAQLVLTLGGDGTLLRAATYANAYNVPLLGINLGHLGFLAELESDEIELLPFIIKNGFECTERMMLNVSILRNGVEVTKTIALNDAVIRSRNGKPTHIVISDQENDLLDYFCDGFIIATPTGSTAYSMSAGGPILEPQSNSIVVTPICPHTLGSRSVVFGGAHPVLKVRVANAGSIQPMLECDGAELGEIGTNDMAVITRHDTPLRLVKLKNKSFYKVLNEKISRRML